jgi:hypothetical protein
VAFYDFFPAVEEARRKAQIASSDPFGQNAFDASTKRHDRAAGSRLAALRKPLRWRGPRSSPRDVDERRATAIYEREAIANLRRSGMHDLADHYERAMAAAPAPQPVDYVSEALRSLGLEWP